MAKVLTYLNDTAYDFVSIGGGYNHDVQICAQDAVNYGSIQAFYRESGFDKLISTPPETVAY